MSNNEQGRYFNQFNPEKNYYEVRALAGRAPQSQEFNEMQAIQRQIVRQNFDVLFPNGTLQKGGSLLQNPNTPASITLTAAKYYYDGLVYDVPEELFTLQGGTEYVGILVTESIIDASQDPALFDPAIGALNFGLAGANRKQITCTWSRASQDNAFSGKPVYEFKDFIQQKYVAQSNIDPVNELLAARTYEESGNYTVNGYDLRLSSQRGSSGEFILEVGNFFNAVGSTAYVMGRQIKTLNTLEVKIPNSKEDTRFYSDSVTWTQAGSGDNLLALDYPTAVQVQSVRAVFNVKRPILSHIANGSDTLTRSDEQLMQVLKVYQASSVAATPSRVYLIASGPSGPGACYQQGNKLNWDVATPVIAAWSSSSPYPAGSVVFYNSKNYQALEAATGAGDTPGSSAKWQEVSLDEPVTGSYYVEALIEVVLPATAYELTEVSGQTFLDLSSTDGASFQLSGEEWSTKPSLYSTLRVDYDYGLPRIDPVFIDEKGSVSSKQGVPSENPAPPQVEGNKLVLGYVKVTPSLDGGKASVVPFNNRRITMLELRQMVDRINRAEMNQAIADLNAQATQKAAATISNLRGILTESFIYSFDDLEEGKVRFESISELTSNNIFELGEQGVFTVSTPAKDVGSVTPTTNSNRKFLTLEKLGQSFIEQQQTARSSGLQVNQFDDYKYPPVVSLTPSSLQTDSNYILSTSSEAYNNIKKFVSNYQLDFATYTKDKEKFLPASSLASKPTTDFAPQDKEITVECSGFLANEVIELTVGGRYPRLKVATNSQTASANFLNPLDNLSAASAETSGSYPVGTVVRCDASGSAKFIFLMPEGIPSGTVQVVARQYEGLRAGASNLTITSQLERVNALGMLVPVIESDLLVENRVKPKFSHVELLKHDGTGITKSSGIKNQTVYNITNETNYKVRVYFYNLARSSSDPIVSRPTTVEVILYIDSYILKKEFKPDDFQNPSGNLQYIEFNESALFQKFQPQVAVADSSLNTPLGTDTKPYNMTLRLFNANSEPVAVGFADDDLIVVKKNSVAPTAFSPKLTNIKIISINNNNGSYSVSYELQNGTSKVAAFVTQLN